jgi:hemolysin III
VEERSLNRTLPDAATSRPETVPSRPSDARAAASRAARRAHDPAGDRVAAYRAAAAARPVLRGFFHAVAVWFAVAGALALAIGAPGPRARGAALVYGATLVVLFGTSALYHRIVWSPGAYLVMRRLDHAAIFLLIAGTYTPVGVLLGGERGHVLLTVVWGGAALGVLRAVLWPRAPKWLAVALYVLLGWCVVPVIPPLHAAIGSLGTALLAAGGAAYTVGAVIYALRRPDPFPRVFGYHELFHVLVVAAAALHFVVAAMAVRAIGA